MQRKKILVETSLLREICTKLVRFVILKKDKDEEEDEYYELATN